MCLAIYLAGSQELPVIPWDESKPAFHVLHLSKEAEAVRKHFKFNYVYYVGTAQGCSCAFNYEHEHDSIVELRDYLRNALICVDQVELFCCKSGDEAMERQHAGIVSPESIALAEFHFRDGQYLLVKRGKASEHATEAERCLQRAAQPVAAATTCNSRRAAKRSRVQAQAVGS